MMKTALALLLVALAISTVSARPDTGAARSAAKKVAELNAALMLDPVAQISSRYPEASSYLFAGQSAFSRQSGTVSKACQKAAQDFVSCFDSDSSGFAAIVDILCDKTCIKALDNFYSSCKKEFGDDADSFKEMVDTYHQASDMFCVTDPDDGELCINKLAPNGQFPIDFNDESTITDENLKKLCIPCYYIFMNSLIRFSAAQAEEDSSVSFDIGDAMGFVSSVCLYDPLAERYCVPYILDEPDCTVDTSSDCPGDFSAYLCASTCHARMMTIAYYFDGNPDTDASDAENTINYLCTKNSNGDFCTAVWVDIENGNINVGGCSADTACTSCATETSDFFDAVGCCFRTGYDAYYSLADAGGQASLDQWYDGLGECAPTSATTACPRYSGSSSSGKLTIQLNVDCDYFKSHQEDATNALLQDFAINNGILTNGVTDFTVTCSKARGKSGLTVSGTAKGNNDDQTDVMKNTFNSFSPDDFYLGSYNTKSGAYYTDKSAAGIAVPSVVIALLSLLLALLF